MEFRDMHENFTADLRLLVAFLCLFASSSFLLHFSFRFGSFVKQLPILPPLIHDASLSFALPILKKKNEKIKNATEIGMWWCIW